MPRYSVTGTVVASTHIGEFDAVDAEQAMEFARNEASVSLCHQCAREMSDPEIEYLTAEDVETGDATSETTPYDQIREYADEIKSLKLALRNIQMYAQKNRHRTTHAYEEEILRVCAEAGVKTEILREDE